MRTDEIAPRVPLLGAEPAKGKYWIILNPAFRAVPMAFLAGMFAIASFKVDGNFHAWRGDGLFSAFWLASAVYPVVRGLKLARR